MTLNHSVRAAVAALALGAVGMASADVLTLTFEGIADGAPVGDFYAAQGISFSSDTLALIDSDAGGSGNFANEPSADTVMFFLEASNSILNYSAGFKTGFSFYYSSSVAATVDVFDGLDGGGNNLGSISLDPQYNSDCTGDPEGEYCHWTAAGVSFLGTARSISFAGAANFTAFDNITFGSADPGTGTGTVPEPAPLALVGAALLGLAAMRRRRA